MLSEVVERMAAATWLSRSVQVSSESSAGTLVLGSMNEFDRVRIKARVSLCFQVTWFSLPESFGTDSKGFEI
jgi:hypothetical protein